MSQMMDGSTESEDAVSLKSNGTPTSRTVRGTMKTLRNSLRHSSEKRPFSPGAKGSKVTPKADTASNESRGQVPASPNPNMAAFGDSFLKKGASFRRSLKFGGKKEKEKNCRQDTFSNICEGPEEAKEQAKVEEEEEVVWEEMEETYTLPEIPHTPLSVMQINNLIEMEVLEEAHLNLLAMRQEFQQERQQCGEDSSIELAKKEKDLNLLYGNLRNKLDSIVCASNSLPSRNKGLLVHVARIIQEEEKRAQEPGGLQGSWMEAWTEAVGEGVKAKVESVHLDRCDQNTSWLSVHLGLLGKAIVEDLENVMKNLRWAYPPSFKVFSTYVRSYHGAVRQHLKKLEQQVTTLKDLYALLDWIINRYKSERIMGSSSLQPTMKDESADLQLEDDFLLQLKEKYCCRAKEDLRSSLDEIIKLEKEDLWEKRSNPHMEENFLHATIPMDIWTFVKGRVDNSRKIDSELEKKVVFSFFEELKQFPQRFDMEFRRHCDAQRPENSPRTEYHITYINSFTVLQQHMENYQGTCPGQVEAFRKEVKMLICRLMQVLEDQFKEDVKTYLRRMMTRKWLTIDDDFKQLYSRTSQLSRHCSVMRPPHVQELASRLHYHVVKEYVGQLMKNNYSCNRRHERAANNIRQQWGKLRRLFEDMNSDHEWLHSVGDDLSNIVGERNQTDIKNHLRPLVENYPDFSRKHLVAVLNFRGRLRGRERHMILQQLAELKKTVGSGSGSQQRVLFSSMEVTANTDCLSRLPFSCLGFLLPDN